MPTSSTTAADPSSSTVTVRSSSSPSTSVSVGRCWKRRMLTSPVVMTWPESMDVTRVIGTKIRRRPGTSTTRPSTRGSSWPIRNETTTSRTRPTWSPAGSNSGVPARRAMKTLAGAPLTRVQVSGGRRRTRGPTGLAAP